MDMRKWFLLHERPSAKLMAPVVRHIPCSDFRSPSVLRLFLAGFECGFKLTTNTGRPTSALRVMAEIMDAQLVTAEQLPPEEQKAFGQAGPTLMDTFENVDGHWYLRGITARVRQAQATTAMPMGRDQWHFHMLPGLSGEYITYKDPDGKRRKRSCWIASCPPDWEMTDDVYNGIFRWTREFEGPGPFTGFQPKPWPDAYTLLREHEALRPGSGEREGSGCPQDSCATPACCVQAAPVGVQYCPADGPVVSAGD